MAQEENKKVCESDVFQVWKEYESIAMHFNELIIKLRTQALGGVAAISAIIGYISSDGANAIDWGLLSAVFFILIIAWAAIYYLDIRYYNLLLEGSVKAILDLEKQSDSDDFPIKLNLSRSIESVVRGLTFSKDDKSCFKRFWYSVKFYITSGRHMFYALVFVALFGASYGSLVQHCAISIDSTAHSHGICRITFHENEVKDNKQDKNGS